MPPESPPSLSPEEAVERYLNHRRTEARQSSVDSWYYELKLFVEWCEEQEITEMSQLSGWVIDQYEDHRRGEEISPVTLNSELQTLKNWLEYLARIEVVDEELPEKVAVPKVPPEAESNDEFLPQDRARAMLKAFRRSPDRRGTRQHVIVELLWWTGCRMGSLRALDLEDYDSEEAFVMFRHRPESGTPLKNGVDGERAVGLPGEVCEFIDRYIERYREDRPDDAGRQPLITTSAGRISGSSIRVACYLATQPCIHMECPHGQDPDTCEYRKRKNASRCPSSLSSHRIRTGSISWQRDCGLPAEVVAARVNAALKTIEKYYDKTTERDRMEKRRRPFLDELGFDTEEDTE